MFKRWDSTTMLIVGATLFLIFSILVYGCAPEMLIFSFGTNWRTNTSQDTATVFGNTVGPLIAWGAAILTFLAFWVQYRANIEQKEQFATQDRFTKIERFENKFYSLVEIHRNNVIELKIGETTEGRKAFISLFNELKFTYLAAISCYKSNYNKIAPTHTISNEELYNISYLIFFFGIGPNSSVIVQDIIGGEFEVFFTLLEEYLNKYQSNWSPTKKSLPKLSVDDGKGSVYTLDIKYMPFNGHTSKLSHYVRHLFQLVKFIYDADSSLFDYEKKYEYASTVRSQLSVHEQLLLYYNAISILGKPWIDEPNYINEYCLIKSLPLPQADFFRKPEDIFNMTNGKGKKMFEWTEIKERYDTL